jgi:O-antigen ligase/Tfp pilus assembly protein PilF
LGAKVALVPLIFDASTDAPFSVPKAVVSHGIAYLLVAVMLGLLLRFRSALFVQSSLHVPVTAFLFASAAATTFAADRALALYGTHARMLGLTSIFDWTILYFGIVLLVRTRKEVTAVVGAALAASALVLGYEVIQLVGRDPFQWTLDSAARPFSTLGHGTVLAQYLTVLAVGAFAGGVTLHSVRPSVRMILLLYSTLLLAGVAVTGTRSAIVGFALGSAVLVLLVWRLHPSRRARSISLLTAVSLTAAIAAVLFFSPIGARLAATIQSAGSEDDAESFASLEPSAAGRLSLWAIGLEMVRERPILGYGPDNFVVGVPRYRPAAGPEIVRTSSATSAHSWVVQVATSSGLVGLVSFVAIALVALFLAMRHGFRPMAICGAAMLAAFLGTGLTTVNEVGTDWLFWIAIGTIAASTASASNPPQNQDRVRRSLARDLLVPLSLVFVAVLAQAPGLAAIDASRSARSSQQLRLSAQPALAIDPGVRATVSDPGRAEYWHVLGLAYLATGRMPDAASAFNRAARLAPYNTRFVGDFARAELILVTRGDESARARARELGDALVRADANNPQAHLTQAVISQVLGNLPAALASVERALALDPNSMNEELYVTATQVMVASGRSSDAIRVARQGLAVFGTAQSAIALRIELVRALVSAAQPQDALTELDKILAIQPNNATALGLRDEVRAMVPRN